MSEIVREWSGTAASVGEALRRAQGRGQLVSVEPLRANERGVAVRVVLRSPDRLRHTPTGPRQTFRWKRVAVGVAVGVGLVGLVVWAVVAVVAWAARHVAEILGAGVVLVLLAAVVVRIVTGGRDEHPCNR